jgi:hypothetical protein
MGIHSGLPWRLRAPHIGRSFRGNARARAARGNQRPSCRPMPNGLTRDPFISSIHLDPITRAHARGAYRGFVSSLTGQANAEGST